MEKKGYMVGRWVTCLLTSLLSEKKNAYRKAWYTSIGRISGVKAEISVHSYGKPINVKKRLYSRSGGHLLTY